MTPQAIGAVVALCVAFWGGWSLKQAQWDASLVAAQKSAQETAQAVAMRLADMASQGAQITERVTHEVKTNTVYRDCRVPPHGVRLLNDAISGREPASDSGVQSAPDAP